MLKRETPKEFKLKISSSIVVTLERVANCSAISENVHREEEAKLYKHYGTKVIHIVSR